MFRRLLLGCSVVAVMGGVNPMIIAPLRAQTTVGTSRPDPVMVALVDKLPQLNQEYAAVILRVASPRPHDVILLPRATATGELLDAAMRTLLHSRALHGERAITYKGKAFHTLAIGVRMNHAPTAWAQKELPLAQRVIDRLQTAPKRVVPDVGTVPVLEFYPPKRP